MKSLLELKGVKFIKRNELKYISGGEDSIGPSENPCEYYTFIEYPSGIRREMGRCNGWEEWEILN